MCAGIIGCPRARSCTRPVGLCVYVNPHSSFRGGRAGHAIGLAAEIERRMFVAGRGSALACLRGFRGAVRICIWLRIIMLHQLAEEHNRSAMLPSKRHLQTAAAAFGLEGCTSCSQNTCWGIKICSPVDVYAYRTFGEVRSALAYKLVTRPSVGQPPWRYLRVHAPPWAYNLQATFTAMFRSNLSCAAYVERSLLT